MSGEPFGGEPRVHDPGGLRGPLPGFELRQFLERVRRPAGPAGGGAHEHQPLDPLGHSDRYLLGDHAIEAHAHQVEGVPPEMIGQSDGVARQVSHGVAGLGDARAANTPAVADRDLEGRGEKPDQGTDVVDGRS